MSRFGLREPAGIMWLSFWRSRDRFSLDELRRLTDQLQRVHIVNEVNKDFVIEALRSIAELITYGDQHDSAFFEYFMEKQVMGEFARILKVSRTAIVSLQLLQTVSIMIQNLKSEHAIYYLFSNEHINFLITYKFDFRNEELLSYYISFLRAISGNLNRNTISLLVKTHNEEVVSFPLYVEAIRFAFHEENMIRTAIRALTLNVYHVGDETVNRFITIAPQANYFSDLVTFFRKQCLDLNGLVLENTVSTDSDASSTILAAVEEIEDNLYYFSDAISAGIPDLGRLLTDLILQSLILPILLPSLWSDATHEQIGAITSLYLLCCILRIVKIKDLANTTAAALFCRPEAFLPISEQKVNGYAPDHVRSPECQPVLKTKSTESNNHLEVLLPKEVELDNCLMHNETRHSHTILRDELLSYITDGNDHQVTGSLNVLATLLQTKELDETMLDALGILPQRKQHKKLLLKALVGEETGEEQLFSSESGTHGDGFSSELDGYLHKLKDQYGLACSSPEVGTSPRVHRYQVLDALASLFCRSNISAETLWDGGWLLRQLLPYTEAEFDSHNLELLKDRYRKCTKALLEEIRCDWADLLIPVVCDEWKKCKRVIEASAPRKEPKSILLPLHTSSPDVVHGNSSYCSGEKMYELVKVSVLLCQLQIFSLGKVLLEQPPIGPSVVHENFRARTTNLDASGPKPGSEIKLVDAVPCRISFERGKERRFLFLASSVGSSGWIILAEELPLKQQHGIVRMAAPLVGSNPKIDDKHAKWLHLRIRPSSLPFLTPSKTVGLGKMKSKTMIDGKWTLAFRDEESCKFALLMISEELNLLREEVETRLKPLVMLEGDSNTSKNPEHLSEVTRSFNASLHLSDASSSNKTPGCL